MMRNCKVCGVSYKTCYSCEKERSWRLHTDTREHYYLWTVLMEYQANHDAKQAYHTLMKRGFDFRNIDEYTPDIQALLMEINVSVQTDSKINKMVVDMEAVRKEDETGDVDDSQEKE